MPLKMRSPEIGIAKEESTQTFNLGILEGKMNGRMLKTNGIWGNQEKTNVTSRIWVNS